MTLLKSKASLQHLIFVHIRHANMFTMTPPLACPTQGPTFSKWMNPGGRYKTKLPSEGPNENAHSKRFLANISVESLQTNTPNQRKQTMTSGENPKQRIPNRGTDWNKNRCWRTNRITRSPNWKVLTGQSANGFGSKWPRHQIQKLLKYLRQYKRAAWQFTSWAASIAWYPMPLCASPMLRGLSSENVHGIEYIIPLYSPCLMHAR